MRANETRSLQAGIFPDTLLMQSLPYLLLFVFCFVSVVTVFAVPSGKPQPGGPILFDEVYKIKLNTTSDDRKHLQHGFNANNWKFRIGDDKKLISFIKNPYKVYSKSNAHRLALNHFFDTSIQKDSSFDNSENIKLDAYWCWKETYHVND